MDDFPDGCTVAEVTREDGVVAPAIWVGASGAVAVQAEALAMAFAEVDLQRPYQQVTRLVSSIAQLLRYYIHERRPELNERALRSFFEQYVVQRAKGNLDFGWKPMSRNALESEVRNIAEFSDFCERHYGYLPLLGRHPFGNEIIENPRKSFWRLMACNEKDFFSHLAIRRAAKHERLRIPGRKHRLGGTDGLTGMTEEFAWELIDAEKNLTYKAIWLLGFFGGPRLSESLNLWVCDVMPGVMRRHWFEGDVFLDLPLVVIANPWHSKWCGKIGDERLTREAYLMKNYGLYPRPLMAETEAGEYRGRTAGFKGSAPTNRSGAMRQIFWASEKAALSFEAIIGEVLGARNRLPRARKHPFLFVNTDRRKPQYQGDMLSLSNTRKAFERAVRRIGGIPYRSKQKPHGMRHLYKDLIKAYSNGDPRIVQICMGHRSRDSQDDYGTLDLSALRHSLAQASASISRH